MYCRCDCSEGLAPSDFRRGLLVSTSQKFNLSPRLHRATPTEEPTMRYYLLLISIVMIVVLYCAMQDEKPVTPSAPPTTAEVEQAKQRAREWGEKRRGPKASSGPSEPREPSGKIEAAPEALRPVPGQKRGHDDHSESLRRDKLADELRQTELCRRSSRIE